MVIFWFGFGSALVVRGGVTKEPSWDPRQAGLDSNYVEPSFFLLMSVTVTTPKISRVFLQNILVRHTTDLSRKQVVGGLTCFKDKIIATK